MKLRDELFGPSKDEVWKRLSKELNGKYYEGNYAQPAKVEVKYKMWTIVLDTNLWGSVSKPTIFPETTRLRALFKNKDNFQMVISSKGFLKSLFGKTEVEIGFPEFERKFIISGNDPKKLKFLFSNPRVRELLLKANNVHFEIRDQEGQFTGTQLPEGVNELYFKVEDIIIDLEQLKIWFELFSEVLNQLCHMDSAYEDDPNIILE